MVFKRSIRLFRYFYPLVAKDVSVRSISEMASQKDLIEPAKRLNSLGTNVWVEFGKINAQYKTVNVGQGFPDYPPPEYLIETLASATKSENDLMHQYTRSQGHPKLVKSIASLFSKLHGREIQAMSEVLITNGAYESLFDAISAFVNEGDEVIIIEPFFDCYKKMISYVGGVPVGIPLRPSKDNWQSSKGWKIDPKELEAAFTSKTKAFIFNTPNNPLGKVFERDEMEMIANLIKKHNVLCISDEVYEWLVYPGSEHIRITTLPGMWDRTVTISSAGKTFSATGWKVGWSVGPEKLISHMASVHANSMYVLPTPTQEAVAIGLEREAKLLGSKESYFYEMKTSLLKKRDLTVKILRDAGFDPVVPDGGYFIMADTSKLGVTFSGESDEPYDFQFCKWMIKEKGISAIPPSAFYHQHGGVAEKFARFCFIKKDSTLQMLDDALKKW
ncbi:kynurenine--oxoglutarate transaminase 1-like isoform X2 [Dendronephthya gigantea]|uniref:kynurenine--oxoglutarate transaminase 1-like isoform X2 n=1 Tax=Dendronephthya gigantea TaxID=151771 RepID=UPI00106D00E6|nr:kynurenine--oxoglutarate transaminase 1-like isoform X2 [Dendronephthya gigantea]